MSARAALSEALIEAGGSASKKAHSLAVRDSWDASVLLHVASLFPVASPARQSGLLYMEAGLGERKRETACQKQRMCQKGRKSLQVKSV